MIRYAVAFALVVGAPSVSLAQGVAKGTAAAADGSKMVCKGKAPTGSRLKKMDCKTQKEWDAIREQNMREMADQQNRPVIDNQRSN